MNSRERVVKTLRHQEVDRLPRHLWMLPGVFMFRPDEVRDLMAKYPSDFGGPKVRFGKSRYAKGDPCQVGEYTDEWGCVWHVGEPGVIGEVKEYILDDWSKLDSYQLPWEILDEADFSEVNKSCAESDLFMLAGTQARPFERMQFLRGTENLFMDLAYGDKNVYKLRDMLHEFFIREMEMWADTDVDGITFMDDWGTQKTLLISPKLWREFYKPLYKDYCDIMHSRGKFVFFHSDGNIESIYPDLIEIGIDAVNSQLFCMDIERLGELYAGKITFWGEIDRQHILPFGTPEDVRNAVARVAKAMLRGKRTGVIAQCEWGIKDPKENIETVFEEWNKI
jgi:uroporphyrinogen decarboxylase